ncbi:hypothetical protein [Mycolicibacterium sarraceniae]|uniref:Uncharacterized protein n=1 Tax=Mycolicibacterium sarraceniae TaxID=1534348 RepID=A0A7I7SKG5_9MYCO|nr:hypothetical protein [Mycolicibacterium sarraceniae]BBY57020.1 hypothetical protein MSAR_01560 [Mycolicibacterium sarraceniae]
MPRRTMTVNRVWYHPLRKTNVEDWGQVRELPNGRDLLEVFVDFAQSDIDNDSLVREDRESYAVVTGVERKNRAVVRQDPAVVKAAKLAGTDIAQAGRSTARLVHEAHSAWRRTAH